MPTGCRFVGWVDPPRRQGTGGELLDGVESGNHARGGVDLQRDRSLNEGLASPRTNFQMMLHITLILAQGHRGGVCGDIQRVRCIARPELVVQRVLTPMPKTSQVTLGVTACHRPCQDDAPPVPRCACPVMTAACEPRVHHTVNPGTRISFNRTPAHCSRTPHTAAPACRSSDASVSTR